MKKLDKLSSGKTKTLYRTDDPDVLWMEYRDDATAFNGEKHEVLKDKGLVNNQFNAFIMQTLSDAGIANHFIELLSPTESLVKALDMIPVECVVRNVTAGSVCKRLGVKEGMVLEHPMFEFFYKNDALGDPLINDSHIQCFKWASKEEIDFMRMTTLKINGVLKKLFKEAGMILVDYKLEFGRYDDQLVLGDEFTPDGCRIWDKGTKDILDKDRFRQGLGDVIESYEIAAKRLGVELER